MVYQIPLHKRGIYQKHTFTYLAQKYNTLYLFPLFLYFLLQYTMEDFDPFFSDLNFTDSGKFNDKRPKFDLI